MERRRRISEKFQNSFRTPPREHANLDVVTTGIKRGRSTVPEEKPCAVEGTLPPWKAFLVQLASDTTAESGICAGRIEHLGSGRRERFTSGAELLATLMRLLEKAEHEARGT
jgi:hypothetical protein